MQNGRRAQSAMEYLMTYGWAILVIAVVLGALYQLGIFGTSTSFSGSSCLAATGFLCQTPVINTTGYLAVKFGEIGISTLTITSIACTTNTTVPSQTQGVSLQLLSGQTARLAFDCPVSSNAIGTSFKGYLWLTYSTPTQSGILDRVAVVTGKISTRGTSIASLGGGGAIAVGVPFTAVCGGTLTTVGGNNICTFTSNGIFTVTGGGGSVAVLVVAGGGGGFIGGGGSGGLVYNNNFAVANQ
ncbi:MAG TPA: hypothetical protein VNF06_01935, partial [Candidatus Aquilonibacter sp.]|nr:hypothetical protein [Candidatus Aquilonibacter sp.]